MKFTGLEEDRKWTNRSAPFSLGEVFFFLFFSHDNDFEAKLLVHHLARSRRQVDIIPHVNADRRFVDGIRFDDVPLAARVLVGGRIFLRHNDRVFDDFAQFLRQRHATSFSRMVHQLGHVQRLHATLLQPQILLVLQIVRFFNGSIHGAVDAVRRRMGWPLAQPPQEQQQQTGHDDEAGKYGTDDGHHVIAAGRVR